jgi:hypothetical protein
MESGEEDRRRSIGGNRSICMVRVREDVEAKNRNIKNNLIADNT